MAFALRSVLVTAAVAAVAALAAAPAAFAAAATCPSADWQLFGDQCFWRSPYQLSWRLVADVCDSVVPGAQPASIHSFAEDAFLAETLMGGERAWLGLHRNDSYISWTWFDSSPYNRYFWACTEPSLEGEACAVINYAAIGQWAAYSCDDSQYFICQVNATQSTPAAPAMVSE